MKIKLTIFDYQNKKQRGNEPIKREYSGIWALEKMIEDCLRDYYGIRIMEKVMDLLRERMKKDDES